MLYEFAGYYGCYSKCDLEIIRGETTTLVICSELPDNPGTSVTNAAELIATQLCHEDPTIDPEGLTWIEHYPERSAGRGEKPLPESWDRVTFTRRHGRTFHSPAWRHSPAEEVQAIRARTEASRQTLH